VSLDGHVLQSKSEIVSGHDVHIYASHQVILYDRPSVEGEVVVRRPIVCYVDAVTRVVGNVAVGHGEPCDIAGVIHAYHLIIDDAEPIHRDV
jgi:hypothetical protein